MTCGARILTEFCYFKPSSCPYNIVHNENTSKIKCQQKDRSHVKFMFAYIHVLYGDYDAGTERSSINTISEQILS